eukprot:jgi/Botrbrau1/8704/Bobra.0311s0017.1
MTHLRWRKCRLETLRKEAGEAELRASQLEQEVAEFTRNRLRKQADADRVSEELELARRRVEELAQAYSRALAESETADAVVTRFHQSAEQYKIAAEQKRQEGLHFALEYKKVRDEANRARGREQRLWEEARAIGDIQSRKVAENLGEAAVPEPDLARFVEKENVPPLGRTVVPETGTVSDFPEPKLTPRKLPDEDLKDMDHDEDLELSKRSSTSGGVIVTPAPRTPLRSVPSSGRSSGDVGSEPPAPPGKAVDYESRGSEDKGIMGRFTETITDTLFPNVVGSSTSGSTETKK